MNVRDQPAPLEEANAHNRGQTRARIGQDSDQLCRRSGSIGDHPCPRPRRGTLAKFAELKAETVVCNLVLVLGSSMINFCLGFV